MGGPGLRSGRLPAWQAAPASPLHHKGDASAASARGVIVWLANRGRWLKPLVRRAGRRRAGPAFRPAAPVWL